MRGFEQAAHGLGVDAARGIELTNIAAQCYDLVDGAPRLFGESRFMLVLPTLGFARVGDTLIVVHSTEPPSDADWDRLMQEPLNQVRATIVVAGATKLDARKRSELAKRVRGAKVNVAVLVSSPVARGVVTALGWLVGGYRAFEMNELGKATSFVGLDARHQAEVQSVVVKLTSELERSKRERGTGSER